MSRIFDIKGVQARGGHCAQISGYMPEISAKRVSCPQWKKRHVPPCHSYHEWETAQRNAPLSSYQQCWGRRARGLPSLSRIMCLQQKGWGGGGWVALAYRPAIGLSSLLPNSPDLALPHLSRSCVPFCQQLICGSTFLYLSLLLWFLLHLLFCRPWLDLHLCAITVVHQWLIMDRRAL